MAEDKDSLGETLRLAERAREDAYFRTLDQALIEQMRQQAHEEAGGVTPGQQLFTPILVPVDFPTRLWLHTPGLAHAVHRQAPPLAQGQTSGGARTRGLR